MYVELPLVEIEWLSPLIGSPRVARLVPSCCAVYLIMAQFTGWQVVATYYSLDYATRT